MSTRNIHKESDMDKYDLNILSKQRERQDTSLYDIVTNKNFRVTDHVTDHVVCVSYSMMMRSHTN